MSWGGLRPQKMEILVQYVRVSLTTPRDGHREDVLRIEEELLDFFRKQRGFVDAYRLTSAGQIGRVGAVDIEAGRLRYNFHDGVPSSERIAKARQDRLVGDAGGLDAFGRAKIRVQELLASYTKPDLDPARVADLHGFIADLAKQAGMDSLPAHDLSPTVV